MDLGLGMIDEDVIIGLIEVDSGQCGDNATYKLYDNGLLEISGTGALWNKSQIAWDSTKVVDVIFGEGITSLSEELFRGYANIRDVHLPSTLTTIGSGAFRNSSLQSINIPEGVETVPSYCFYTCSNLLTLTLPSTVTKVNAYSCRATNLPITVLATTPPAFGTNAFNTAFSTTSTIYVPYDSVDAYKTRWSSYASQIQPIVTIGDMIDLDTQSYQMYHMTEEDLTAVGIRIYGTQDGISMLAFLADDETQGQTSGYRHMWTKNLSTTLYEGDYMDIYSASIDDSTTDPQPFQTFLAAFAHTDKLWVKKLQQGGDILTQFSFIFKGTTDTQSTPTRTLATDPMIRSTLSTISDTLDPNIEDD